MCSCRVSTHARSKYGGFTQINVNLGSDSEVPQRPGFGFTFTVVSVPAKSDTPTCDKHEKGPLHAALFNASNTREHTRCDIDLFSLPHTSHEHTANNERERESQVYTDSHGRFIEEGSYRRHTN